MKFRIQKADFHPSRWTFRFYWGTALVLLLINFFGPRGLVSLILSFQDLERLEERQSSLSEEISGVQKDIALFKNSSTVKQRVLREELGYLQKDELSIEIMNP